MRRWLRPGHTRPSASGAAGSSSTPETRAPLEPGAENHSRPGADRALADAGRRGCPRGPGGPLPGARQSPRRALRRPRRAVRRPRPGGLDRPAEVHRPVRLEPRRTAHHLRHAHDRGGDQAALPRPRLGRPRTTIPAGDAGARARHDRPPDLRAGRRAHRRRHREGARGQPTKRCWTPCRARTPARPRSSPSGTTSATSGASSFRSRSWASHARTPGSCSPRAWPTSTTRDRRILRLRFEEGLTQSQIAAKLGISQMHVSRLLRRSLEALRESVGEIDELPGE